MHLIIIGCEYTGKTTLAAGIKQWIEQRMGNCATSFHDHFLPWDPEDAGPKGDRIEEDLKLLTLNDPRLIEKYMRYVMHYHTHPNFYAEQDHCVVNWYYGDVIYGPLYYSPLRAAANHSLNEAMISAEFGSRKAGTTASISRVNASSSVT